MEQKKEQQKDIYRAELESLNGNYAASIKCWERSSGFSKSSKTNKVKALMKAEKNGQKLKYGLYSPQLN